MTRTVLTTSRPRRTLHPASRTLRAAPAALVLAVSVALAACGGGATPVPALEDPADIIVAAVTSIQSAKSVHVAVELDGEIPLDLSDLLGGGTGTGGGSFDVTGTTIDGDVDVEDQAAKLTFALPGLLNLQGEVIIVDGSAFVKVNLLGDKYQVFDSGDVMPGASPDSSADPSASIDPAQAEAEIREAIDGLSSPPVKLADEQCGDTTCYHVQVKLDDTDTGPIASLAPGVTATGTLDLYVRKNDLRPSRIVLSGDATDSGESGNLTATITFSAWDAAVDIQAPPADQVTEGDGLPFPSFGN